MSTAYSKEQVSSLHEQTFTYLIVEEDDHVLNLTLNRPEKKNAMNPVFMNEIVYALTYAHYTPEIWMVVFRANGDIFTAGADLKAFSGAPQDEVDSTIPPPETMVVIGDAIGGLHKPCIAKVHANVYAGGFLLICGCTHVIAADSAQFSLPEVKRGIWPMQVMASLAPIMPARKLLDLCMRGKAVEANEALTLGLATQVVAADQLEDEVLSLVAELKTLSPSAIRLGLKAWDELKGIQENERHPFLLQMLGEILQTQDAAEGMMAFREKRKPEWKGK